ncbi:MAG: prepilin-type N-terminal cleavage/methylation domain-containing protein [Phycisphaerales bacterium]|nr:prepilin-type N-terminal cleavage/methylation domain-containing protein [Phycisphaerales bacterium]
MKSGRSTPRITSSRIGGAAPGQGAFTLVELMVVIVVLAILIALVIPALGEARQKGKDSTSLSLQRQAFGALSMYATDNKSFHPYFQTPGEPNGPKILHGFDLPRQYFNAGRGFWATLVVPAYFEPGDAIDVDPRGRREWNAVHGYPVEVVSSRLALTDTAFAVPKYWQGDLEPTDASLFRGTTHSDIAFPSNKGLTVDLLIGALVPSNSDRRASTPSASVGKCDGSASFVAWPDTRSDLVVERSYGAIPLPVLSTRDGLRGRDFR